MTVRKCIVLLLCVLLSMSAVAQTDENTQPFYLWDTPYQQPEQTEADTGISLDSIFPPREIQAPLLRPSLFNHTTLPVTHDDLQQRAFTTAAPWLFAMLIILIALMFLYYNRNKLRIADLLKAAADHRAMDRLVRGNNLNTTRLVPMGLFVTVTLATSVYLMALTHNGITAWLVLAAALFTAYILRNLVARLLGQRLRRWRRRQLLRHQQLHIPHAARHRHSAAAPFADIPALGPRNAFLHHCFTHGSVPNLTPLSRAATFFNILQEP